MIFDILTLFPEMFDGVLGASILKRATEKGILEFNTINIRDFADNKHNRVDDTPYGGGRGMVMQAPPIYSAYESIEKARGKKPHLIYMSPKGKVLTQSDAIRLSKMDNIAILCGHYEGVDERIIEEIVDEQISIGDYVLTGGELPAMVLIDTISRMIEGVLSNEESFTDESHFNGLLEYPHYTRPFEFHGMKVPDVLLSGNHAEIEKWRKAKSIETTKKYRPDLLKGTQYDEN